MRDKKLFEKAIQGNGIFRRGMMRTSWRTGFPLFVISIVITAGCNPEIAKTTLPPPVTFTGVFRASHTVPAITGTHSETPSLSPTKTRKSTATETAWPTPWPEGYTPTTRPTPTRGLPPTATQSKKETCPPPTNTDAPVQLIPNPEQYEQQLLAFLVAYGNLRGFMEGLKTQMEDPFSLDINLNIDLFEVDVTGDSNKEFLIGLSTWDIAVFYFFGCRNGKYAVLHRITLSNYEKSSRWFAALMAVDDINKDGIREIIYFYESNAGMRFTDYSAQVLEWDGGGFRELLLDETYPGSEWNRYAVDAQVEFWDIDGNEVMDLVFPARMFWNDEGMGVYRGCDGGVDRNSFAIWMWDGEYYRFMWREKVPPVYRFQAAYDGDYFTSIGLFDRAEEMYIRAIFDEKLKPGSFGDWTRDMQCGFYQVKEPDATEPMRIRAYALFRLVELLVNLDRLQDAEYYLEYLNDNHPESTSGNIFANLANAFWLDYAENEDIATACLAVKREAESNSTEVFDVFSNYDFNNPGPTLDTICPFQ